MHLRAQASSPWPWRRSRADWTKSVAASSADSIPAPMMRVPWAAALCHDLEIDGELVSPVTRTAHIFLDGTRHPMPVFAEASIADLPRIYINGGKRGYLVELEPKPALALLQATLVQAAA